MARRQDIPAAIVDFGGLSNKISIYGDHETFGFPTVEMQGEFSLMKYMRPEDADRLAEGLTRAARMARGEVPPTVLDAFLEKRK